MSQHQDMFAPGMGQVSVPFAERIRAAYRLAAAATPPVVLPIWTRIAHMSDAVHEALMGSDTDRLRRLLATPAEHHLFFGYDNLFKDDVEAMKADPAARASRAAEVAWLLACLGESLGCVRVLNPELGAGHPSMRSNPDSTAAVLQAIGRITGPLRFPNPFRDEHGLRVGTEVASHRAIRAIYQSWRARCLSERFGPRVLEIGAGLGRSVYYARQFGLVDYVSVDLPMALVAQAAYLGLVLGEDQVALTGEPVRPGQIALYSPEYLLKADLGFDLLVNMDSLTEMTLEQMGGYVDYAVRQGAALLSINHECNEHTVVGVAAKAMRPEYRCPFWLRAGYVEELFVPRTA